MRETPTNAYFVEFNLLQLWPHCCWRSPVHSTLLSFSALCILHVGFGRWKNNLKPTYTVHSWDFMQYRAE